jgi:hypothetical protein
MPYIPLHDLSPYRELLSSSTSTHPPQLNYAPPLGPAFRSASDMADAGENGNGNGSGESSRKRQRDDNGYGNGNGNEHDHQDLAPSKRPSRPAPPTLPPVAVAGPSTRPQIFPFGPRNEITKILGGFIMAHCRDRQHVEVSAVLILSP